jgi:hypothetical protein
MTDEQVLGTCREGVSVLETPGPDLACTKFSLPESVAAGYARCLGQATTRRS